MGQHPALQGRADPPQLRHRGRSDTPGRGGVLAQPVVLPTVALERARIRTIVTAAHTDDHLDSALETFADVGRELALTRS